MLKFKQFFKRDKFAASCGIELVECRPGYAKAKVAIREQHLNGANVVHGGLIFTLADFAFAAAVNSYGVVSLSINASISYFTKSDSGIFTAEAIEISRNNRLCTCDINIYNADGNCIANFKGTAYITKEIIDF